MAPRWRYLVSEVGVGLRRNPLMVVATVVTVTVSLALLGAGLLVQRQVDLARDLFYSQVEVSIFLKDGISESQRRSLERDLLDNPEVANVLYESKQDAYEHFQRIFADDPEMRESVTPEILPASFRVQLVNPEQFAVVQSQYVDHPVVEEVTDQREVLEKFFQVMDALRNGAMAIALLQLAGAAALIANTIRVTAFARREQTGIMKLVGATNWYIRLPFLLEGVIAGALGALIAGGLLLVADATLVARLKTGITFIPFFTREDVLRTIPVLLAIGVGIAAVASMLSLRRFLRV
jgi:cell division transport system permease protein